MNLITTGLVRASYLPNCECTLQVELSDSVTDFRETKRSGHYTNSISIAIGYLEEQPVECSQGVMHIKRIAILYPDGNLWYLNDLYRTEFVKFSSEFEQKLTTIILNPTNTFTATRKGDILSLSHNNTP